jgi:hypothetical protein
MNRRSFLKQSISGLGGAYLLSSPLNLMLGNILSSVFQRAWALDQGESGFLDKKLINISLSGGMSRWMFDLPLRPNGDDLFQYNANNDPRTSMLITKLNPDPLGPGGFTGEYATVEIGGYHLPVMWGGKIATVGGGSENMSVLAQNMMFMRGIKSVDSHSLGRTLQTKPNGGISTGGAVADRATTVLPALSMGTINGSYKSAKGIAPQEMPLTDPFSTAFLPFMSAGGLRSNSASTGSAIDAALDIMRAKAGSRHKMVPFTYEDRINARKLMNTQFTNLSGAYTDLRNKYLNLISRSMGDVSLRQAGVDNLVVPGSAVGPFKISNGTTTTHYTGSNLSTITDSTSSVGRLAEMMAVAEFMICGGSFNRSFSSTLHAELGILGSALFDSMTVDGVVRADQRFNLITDAHFTGSYIQLVQFTRMYRALASCLHELVLRLKAVPSGNGNLFDKTVIALHSEFSRSARDAGDGSDHGPNGSCYTLLSGMISAPLVVGDITKDGGRNGYRGTWGTGAPMVEFSQQQAVVGNAASTVALMLGFPTPTPNNAPYVNIDSATGKVKSVVGRARNVG